jgi:SAM-dependent methyltransferase
MSVVTSEGTGGDWAKRTYEAMAPVYDDFTAHHDCETWIADLLGMLQRHDLQGKRLLDVGCGTGNSFLPMLPRGWKVAACDLSPAMLDRAREKADGAVRFAVANMLELPKFGEFDLVWALDDAVNYLLSQGELELALRGMRTNLSPTGLLLFDVNTLQAYRTFGAETAVVERGGRRLIWRGMAEIDAPPGAICESQLEIGSSAEHVMNGHRQNGDAQVLVHRQRHFPEAQVLAALQSADLDLLDVYGYGFDGAPHQPLEELAHNKAVYIARAAG